MKMGRIVILTKKWWILAIVVTLALSLTSCAKKKNNDSDTFAVTQCDGTLGQFDVYVFSNLGQSGQEFELVVIPIQPVVEGALAQIGILDNRVNTLPYDIVKEQIALQSQVEISARLTLADLANYPALLIRTVPQSAGGFIREQAAADAACIMNVPVSAGFSSGF